MSLAPSASIPTTMTAVEIQGKGGPEVLVAGQVETPRAGPGRPNSPRQEPSECPVSLCQSARLSLPRGR